LIQDSTLNDTETRHKQLGKLFGIRSIEPECKDEYVRVPVDLPIEGMIQDINEIFEQEWYGMVHRRHSEWNRSVLYGGVGLTYNPDYIFDIPRHAQGLGQPRSQTQLSREEWIEQTQNKSYEPQVLLKNSYNDCLGLRVRNEVTYMKSLRVLFDKLKVNMFQGRIAEIRPHAIGPNDYEDNKEFMWHVDEPNEIVSRLLIPLVYSDDYYIEFADSGNKIRFEPGYAYHWNTRMVHRWGYDYSDTIQNRTCIVLGLGSWIKYEDGAWSTNEYFNKMHPTDMITQGKVI
tara:strand:- start:863 stop:1723 length:861 start_codon:yes stop_codon:yes gene_type:complete